MRRNSNDIEADILRITADGAKKTYIVYQANLNFKIVKKYLSSLIERGYIAYDGSGKGGLYFTTPRGFEFLRRYDALQSMSEPLLAVRGGKEK